MYRETQRDIIDLSSRPIPTPENIQKDIAKIIEEAHKEADPTKLSPLTLDKDSQIYQRMTHTNEIFISFLCRGILNFCPIVWDKKTKKYYSIWLNPKNIEEKGLWMSEIIADISLFCLLFDDTDRGISLSNNYQNWSVSIQLHNCEIFKEWTYSLYDCDTWWVAKKLDNNILKSLYEVVQELYSTLIDDDFIPWEYFLELDRLWEDFGTRIYKKVCEFLERYDWEDGKIFFFRQYREAILEFSSIRKEIRQILDQKEDIWFDWEKEMYDIFIFNLKKIKNAFETDLRSLELYIIYDEQLVKKEMIASGKRLIRSIREFFSLKLRKIIPPEKAWKILWVNGVKSFDDTRR